MWNVKYAHFTVAELRSRSSSRRSHVYEKYKGWRKFRRVRHRSARGQQPRSEELTSISMEVLSPLFEIYILFYMNIAEQSCEAI